MMIRKKAFAGFALWLAGCPHPKEPQNTDPTEALSTTAGGTTSDSTGSTGSTSMAGGSGDACSAPDVVVSGVCFRRQDLLDLEAHFIAACDCDADGRNDLIVDNFFAKEVSLLYVSQTDEVSQSLSSPRQLPGNSEMRIFTADFDALDTPNFGVLRGSGLEVFTMTFGSPGPSVVLPFSVPEASEVAGAIVDAPGSPARLFVGNLGGAKFWRLVEGTFVPDGPNFVVPECGYPSDIRAADFNGDGRMDVVLTGDDRCGAKDLESLPPAEARVLLMQEDMSLAEGSAFLVGTSPTQIVTADFDGDGKVDVAVLNEKSEDITVRLGAGDGTFGDAVSRTLGSQPVSLAAGDLDGNGSDELLVLTRDAGSLASIAAPHEAATPILMATGLLRPVVVADLNADGSADVAARADAPESHVVLLLSDTP